MAGFCDLATGLQAPIFGILKEKWTIVSGGHLKNSRFWEIAARDLVRSALRARCGSVVSAKAEVVRKSLGSKEVCRFDPGRPHQLNILQSAFVPIEKAPMKERFEGTNQPRLAAG